MWHFLNLQIVNGYFVHHFSPDGFLPMRKNVVFVLDTSGSMGGFKERQMKEAMATILPDLREQDNFGIVFFETTTRSWKEHLVPACKSNIEDAAFAVNYVRARGGWYPCCLLTLRGAEGRMTLPLQNSLTRKCLFLVFYNFWVNWWCFSILKNQSTHGAQNYNNV